MSAHGAHLPAHRDTGCRRSRRPLAVVGIAVAAVLATTTGASAYVVADGDTLSGIAARHGVSVQTIAQANQIADPDLVVSGTTLVIPTAGGGTSTVRHVVQPGETLSQIAATYGVTVSALAAANGITDPDRIRSGQALSVGGSGATTGGTTSGGQTAGGATSGGTTAAGSSVRALITAAAGRHGWRPAVPLGLAMQESGWNNSVVSSAGARGIMQVMPATGDWVGTYLLGRTLDLSDPADNVAAGMAYLDYLYGRFRGDLVRTLAAYYEGPRRVEENGPSEGGRRYAANVMALADRYR